MAIVSAVVVAILIAAGIWLGPPVPKRTRLGSVAAPTNSLHFLVPSGDHFVLVIGGDIPTTWDGRGLSNLNEKILTVEVTDGSERLYRREITQRNAKLTGLLAQFGIATAYSLTEPAADDSRPFADCLKSGRECEVTIKYHAEPPRSAELWLVWLGHPRL